MTGDGLTPVSPELTARTDHRGPASPELTARTDHRGPASPELTAPGDQRSSAAPELAAPGAGHAPASPGPVPHWPGTFVSLGDHQVFVRTTAADGPRPPVPEPDSTKLEYSRVDGSTPPTGPAALFVHGLEGSSRNWTDLMDLLRTRLACDAVDLPGFGDSPPRPDGRYSIAALAQTVIALIERRGRGPVHLAGNSLGGAVCVRVAATRPELVRTLTLISPALPDSRPRLDLLRFPLMSVPRLGIRLLRQYQNLPAENRVADVIANCYSDPALFHQTRFAAEVTELSRRDSLDYATAALLGSIRTLTAEFFRSGRAWQEAARVTAPTLVIYGSHDRLVDPRNAGRAARAFRDARIVVLPRTGHVAHMEHPSQVAAEMTVLLAAAGEPAREFPLTSAG